MRGVTVSFISSDVTLCHSGGDCCGSAGIQPAASTCTIKFIRSLHRAFEKLKLLNPATPSRLAVSARRRGCMDQDEEQVVWIPNDANLESVGTRGQIEWLAAR